MIILLSHASDDDGLKKHGKKWIDELACALWGNQTSPSRATGETPFFMVYGVEAVLPLKVTMGSLRVQAYDESAQDQLRCEDIDLVDERRYQSTICMVMRDTQTLPRAVCAQQRALGGRSGAPMGAHSRRS
jgi:hypothetical protein